MMAIDIMGDRTVSALIDGKYQQKPDEEIVTIETEQL
jgi:hypothetical protein